ncbi:MAG: SH3 domain-containing protein [Nonlabens sp.]|uniref:SH3 domain-containing protein n=1 Tax=Nonlabens sp. TaxID=1888209 RepID=UPI003EF2BA3F
MKVILNILFIVVFLCHAFAKAQLKPGHCYFITAESGLNLRSGPGTDYDVVEKLPYGAQLKVIENVPATGKTHVLDNGVKKYGQWVKVAPTFYDYLYAQKQEMYVFDVFLSQHLNSIPPASLHNFVELYDVASHDDYKPLMGVSSRREMWETGQQCDVRYENNPAAKEALKNIIQFEVVRLEDYIKQKMIGNYEIDDTWQPKKFKLEHDYRPVEWEQYYLPLDGGRDSILIKDHTGEWASKTEYYGQIDELDSYLISGFAEDAEVIMVNRTTGKKSILSSGFPNISPRGEYMIAEYYNGFDSTTYFTVTEFDEETIPQGAFITFSSWITAGGIFWIAENQFIIGVLPMDTAFQNDAIQSKTSVIYLKGTIQF